MAQQLWLLRHGDAEPHDARPDPERRLTAGGERQAQAAGRALRRLGVEMAACHTSPRVRAADTARLACEALDLEPQRHDPLSSGFDAEDADRLLDGEGSDVRLLLVGHEPDFSQLLLDLTGARAEVKKGGMAVVRLVGRRRGELVVLLRPRELEALAQ